MSKINGFVTAFLLVTVFLWMSAPAFADAASYSSKGLGENNADPLTGLTVTSDENVNGGVPTVNVPNVQIEQAKDFVERRGFDVVGLMQTFGQPFAIILFIFGAFLTGAGAMGKSSGAAKGVIVMVIAILVYAAVLSGPELMDFGNAWLKS
ncbi:hypothetical protein [Psychrobacillus sp. FSL K6-1464]|uniref:hypothetical protein n=1 Tax=Psychrobacillus sp. FSL K6-1464 TaxID=2921545 RepID=UPI0030F8D478